MTLVTVSKRAFDTELDCPTHGYARWRHAFERLISSHTTGDDPADGDRRASDDAAGT